jgi:hypothetical protein
MSEQLPGKNYTINFSGNCNFYRLLLTCSEQTQTYILQVGDVITDKSLGTLRAV